MAATTVKATFAGFQGVKEQTETVAANRVAQNSTLSELPGLAFGLLTLVYIVSSFASLL